MSNSKKCVVVGTHCGEKKPFFCSDSPCFRAIESGQDCQTRRSGLVRSAQGGFQASRQQCDQMVLSDHVPNTKITNKIGDAHVQQDSLKLYVVEVISSRFHI